MEMCIVEAKVSINGWSQDEWVLSKDAISAMADIYRAMIRPLSLVPFLELLSQDGYDLEEYFEEEDADNASQLRANREMVDRMAVG